MQNQLRNACAALLVLLPLLHAASCEQNQRGSDVNADGWVDAHDLARMDLCIAQPALPECARADVQGDGDVDAADRGVVQRNQGARVFSPLTPQYQPRSVHLDGAGVVYLYSGDRSAIYRWSLPDARPLSPIALGPNSLYVTLSAANRALYVAYTGGAITRIDTALPIAEAPFVTLAADPRGLAMAGAYLFAVQFSADGNLRTFAPNGSPVSVVSGESANASGRYAWNPALERMYYIASHTPSDIEWHEIDAGTGVIGAEGESPYHGDLPMAAPFAFSPDGARLLSGTGQLFAAGSLLREAWIPDAIVDASWSGDGLFTARNDGSSAVLVETWNTQLERADVTRLPGQAYRVLRFEGQTYAVTGFSFEAPSVHAVPSNGDGDGDGVPYADDAFPVDPAASQDSDRDGYADAWNPGYTGTALGTQLDAFPDDAGCQLVAHGAGGVCDSVAVLPTSSGEAFCDSDAPFAGAAEGSTQGARAFDFVPLCSGWVLIGDRTGRRIVAHNVLNGRGGARFPLPALPGQLELDEANQLLYVEFPERNAVGRLDLLTGEVDTIHLPLRSTSLSLGPLGGLFVVTASLDAVDAWLHWLPAGAGAIAGTWPIDALYVRWNPVHAELLAADTFPSSILRRYSFDPAAGLTLLQARYAGSSDGRRLALSPDGERVAHPVPTGNLAAPGPDPVPPTIFDYVSTDLASRYGEWPLAAPLLAAFSPDGARLLAASEAQAVVFGVEDHVAQVSHLLSTQSFSFLHTLGWSRGGTLALVHERRQQQSTDLYHWIVTPD